MNRASRQTESRPNRILRSRYVAISALVAILLVIAYFIAPRRAGEIVTVDREHAWQSSAAPPQRKIIWRPAEPFETPAGDASTRNSLIRPQLAERGAVLYFTLRSPDRGADIFRSRLRDGKWQPAEPVVDLNTASDDIGPVLQPGEERLYFYSNRPGGYGGFDLYVSDRTKDGGWSESRNLGPHINSSAHEYDPAVTADGQRLFFSSNRTPHMGRQMANDKLGRPGDRWDSTLRADLGLPTFDLYAARRESPDAKWSPAVPLSGVNRPGTNEGSPYVSPAGIFIYFASDRPQRSGEPRNFDLYRARIAGDRTGRVQNLGTGVNTHANEIEPALSEEGFRLVFSRDVADESADGGSRFRLYTSLASEVTEEVYWDTTSLATVFKVIRIFWWWIVLALLLAALIAVLVWYLQQLSIRRLPLPVFVLLAIVIHILLGIGSFFVYFGDEIVAQIKRDLEEVAMITHLSSEDEHQSHEKGEEAYEKVADLEHVETVKPTEVDRQVTETPNVPITPQVLAPNVPTKLTRDRTLERPDATLPRAKTVLSGGPELARRSLTDDELMLEHVEVEKTEASESAKARPVDVEVALARRRPVAEPTDVPQIARRTLNPAMELAQERVEAEQSTEAPAETPPDQQTVELDRAARSAAQPDATETIRTENVEAFAEASAAPGDPRRVDIEFDRRVQTPQTGAPEMARRALSADAALRVARADTSAERTLRAIPPAASNAADHRIPFRRAEPVTDAAAAPPEITTERLAAPAPTVSNGPVVATVAVGRTGSEAPDALTKALPDIGLPRGVTPLRMGVSSVEVDRCVTQPRPTIPARTAMSAPLTVRRVSDSGSAEAAAVGRVETATFAPPAAGVTDNGETASPRSVSVGVSRRGVAAPAPQGGSARVAVVSYRPGLSGLNETAQRVSGTAPTPTPKTNDISAELARMRGTGDLSGIAESQVMTETHGELAAGGKAKADTSGGGTVEVKVARRGTRSVAGLPGTLQLAMVGSSVGSPRLSDQSEDARPAYDAPVPGSAKVAGELARANRGLAQSQAALADVAAETIGTSSKTGDGEPDTPISVAGISIGLERTVGPMLELPIKTSGKIGGVHRPDNHRLVIGSLESHAVDSPPSFSPVTSLITRRPARAPQLLYAEDSIGLTSMMRFRQVDEEEKRDLVEAFGGDDNTLKGVRSGLVWIAKQQHSDGHWSLNWFADGKSSGHGSTRSDTAATALALLPLLGDGNTHNDGPHRKAVLKGLQWLFDHQKENGDLYTGGGGNTHMYSHGIATIALCEAYGMTRDPQFQEPAQRAVDFIVAAQHKEGGWRYTPGQPGDTSVFGWQIMALKSAQMAELNVPPEVLVKSKQWLDRAKRGAGEFGYQPGSHSTPAMTAEGLLCHQYLGASRSDARLQQGAEFLLKHVPQPGKDTSYCWYYATQVMYHMQGEYWQSWNEAMKETLLDTQLQSGPMTGSWDPKDNWERSGGRLYSTSLRILMLEVYYRHLPLYQVFEQ